MYLFSFLKKRSGTSIEKGEQQQTPVFEGLLEEGRGEGMRERKRVEEEGEQSLSPKFTPLFFMYSPYFTICDTIYLIGYFFAAITQFVTYNTL